MTASNDRSKSEQFLITRRQVHAGGVMLLATGLVAAPAFKALAQTQLQAAAGTAGVISKGGGTKPTYLPAPNSTDPVAHSLAEHFFWHDQMAEHAAFFVMLMPGPELAVQRGQAEGFKAIFEDRRAKAQGGLDRSNFAAFNRGAIDQIKRFADFKHQMGGLQSAGKLKSLVWPTFFDHTAREAEYFMSRLTRLSQGDVTIGRTDTISFWASVMGEHADFIAHLLDPKEAALIKAAFEASDNFKKLHNHPTAGREAAVRAVDGIIDFKTAAEKGIKTGQIKSIIHPALADHVRREALKAADELARAV